MDRQLDLKAIKARASAATPGPWTTIIGLTLTDLAIVTEEKLGADEIAPEDSAIGVIWGSLARYEKNVQNNAEFIAHARADVEELVAEVEQLMHNNEVLKQIALDLLAGWKLSLTEDGVEEAKNLLEDVLVSVGQRPPSGG